MMSDMMISGGTISSDGMAYKVEPFHADWHAMIAGNDISQCIPIIDRAARYFNKRANTLAVARSVFKKAFQQHAIEMREDAVLSTYGMKMDDFLKAGKRRFTERQFASICERMDAVKPDCEFLVTGFDSLGRPHIFHVAAPGNDSVYDKPGFCAIGSGKWAAETILYSLGQCIDKNLGETIYSVCAAKFMAEKSDGVGEQSYLFAKKKGTIAFSHNFSMVGQIRDAWKKDGCPKEPDGIARRIYSFGLGFS